MCLRLWVQHTDMHTSHETVKEKFTSFGGKMCLMKENILGNLCDCWRCEWREEGNVAMIWQIYCLVGIYCCIFVEVFSSVDISGAFDTIFSLPPFLMISYINCFLNCFKMLLSMLQEFLCFSLFQLSPLTFFLFFVLPSWFKFLLFLLLVKTWQKFTKE